MSRRPKPCRSGQPGCAPTTTPNCFANRTVFCITDGSPACIPQAMLAEVMKGMMDSSFPKPSPISQLRSILIMSFTLSENIVFDSTHQGAISFLRVCHCCLAKTDRASVWCALGQHGQICACDRGDLGITACCWAIRHHHNRLSNRRNLDCTHCQPFR